MFYEYVNKIYIESICYSRYLVRKFWAASITGFCAYSLRTCFVAADHWFLVFSVMLKIASSSCTSDLVT